MTLKREEDKEEKEGGGARRREKGEEEEGGEWRRRGGSFQLLQAENILIMAFVSIWWLPSCPDLLNHVMQMLSQYR